MRYGTKICEECGEEFEIKYPGNPNKLCSKECRYKKCSRLQRDVALTNNPMRRPGAIAKWKKSFKGKTSGDKHHNWKGGVEIDIDGYRKTYCPDHPNAHKGKYLEHRLVVEESIGRILSSDEIVHHINGDKLDNRIENLEIVTRSNHLMMHLFPEKL